VYLCRTGSPRGFTGPLEGGGIDPGVDGDVIAVVEVARDSSARSPRRSLKKGLRTGVYKVAESSSQKHFFKAFIVVKTQHLIFKIFTSGLSRSPSGSRGLCRRTLPLNLSCLSEQLSVA